MPLTLVAARTGSANAARTASVAGGHAAAASAGTTGAGSDPSSEASTRRWVSTTWATTSRAVHSLHGVRASHPPGGTPFTRRVKPSATLAYRSDISDIPSTLSERRDLPSWPAAGIPYDEQITDDRREGVGVWATKRITKRGISLFRAKDAVNLEDTDFMSAPEMSDRYRRRP